MDFKQGLRLCLIFAGIVLARPAAADAPPTVTFQVNTILDSIELGEEEAVTINGQSVGSLKVEGETASAVLNVTVPAAKTYAYTLCGHIKLPGAKGDTVTRKIDSAGTLANVNGRNFGVFSGDDIVFYLLDMHAKDGGPIDLPRVWNGCPDTVAMR